MLGFHVSFSVEHHFSAGTRPPPPDVADGADRAHHDAAARHRRDGAALAQSGAAGRAGRDARSLVQRPFRFRHRQGLPAQRVQRLSIAPDEAEARFEEAVEVMTRAFTSRARASRIMAASSISRTSWSNRRRRKAPHPPSWVAAGNPHTIARAAARGFNLILDQYAVARNAVRAHRIYKVCARSAGPLS